MRARGAFWDRSYPSLRPRPLAGNALDLLCGGDEYFPALERALDAAQREVFVETYLFAADPTGWRIAHALARAARRGVAVHLVIDGFGCADFEPSLASVLRESGVQLAVFRPQPRLWSFERQHLRRLHRKLAVIDGERAFVGGLNLIDDRLDSNHGALAQPRADFAVALRGPLVAQVHWAAWRLWWQLRLRDAARRLAPWAGVERRRSLLATLPAPPLARTPPIGRTRAMLVLRDNLRLRHAIERAYLRALGQARREVLIASAYFLPGLRFRRALLAALGRGVRVRLMLQGRREYWLPHWAQQALYEELLAAGAEIVEYHASFLHAKAAVIDDWATVGSSNIDPFSLLLAREANVVVFEADFARRLRAAIEALMASGGRPLPAQRHARRPLFARVLQQVAFVLVRIAVALSGRGGGSLGRY